MGWHGFLTPVVCVAVPCRATIPDVNSYDRIAAAVNTLLCPLLILLFFNDFVDFDMPIGVFGEGTVPLWSVVLLQSFMLSLAQWNITEWTSMPAWMSHVFLGLSFMCSIAWISMLAQVGTLPQHAADARLMHGTCFELSHVSSSGACCVTAFRSPPQLNPRPAQREIIICVPACRSSCRASPRLATSWVCRLQLWVSQCWHGATRLATSSRTWPWQGTGRQLWPLRVAMQGRCLTCSLAWALLWSLRLRSCTRIPTVSQWPRLHVVIAREQGHA